MRQWLVKLLGGFTELEMDRLQGRLEDYRDLVHTRDENYASMVHLKDLEIKRLTDLMLTRAGFIVPLTSQTEEKIFQPINKRLPWAARQKQLEQEDAKKQADLTLEHWKNKQAQEQQSAG